MGISVPSQPATAKGEDHVEHGSGAGLIGHFGRRAAAAFAAAGWEVRRYARGTDMAAAAQGAQVIVNGLNPPNTTPGTV